MVQALKELEYPHKLQRLLLTPQREVLLLPSFHPLCCPSGAPVLLLISHKLIIPFTARLACMPPCLKRGLRTSKRSTPQVLVELVITKDNGEIETYNAYRVQHDDSRGPYKGGLRYHPQVDLDDVRR